MNSCKILGRIFVCAALLIGSSSCRRYTAPQDELVLPNTVLGGEDLFREFERLQQSRLANLLAVRSSVGLSPSQSYRVGPDDLIQLQVFDADELSATSRVRADGQISFPIIGQLQVAGLSESELEQKLQTELTRFMHSPKVRVSIMEFSAHKVSVIGEVAKPGTYALRRTGYSLTELLSEAGGRTDRAGGTLILIPSNQVTQNGAQNSLNQSPPNQSPPNQGPHGIEIEYDSLAGSIDRPPLVIPLVPGDTVMVPLAGSVHVDGEVNKPGNVKLDSRTTLLGAIAGAEGMTYSANSAAVEIIRELGAGKKALMTVDVEKVALLEGQDIRLRDGDVVRVPSQRNRFALQQVVELFNSVFNVGVSAR